MENANGVIKKLTSAERSYYTAAEVREMMGVSRDTAYRMIRSLRSDLIAKDLEKDHQAAERILNAMDNSSVPISWHEMDRMALQSVIAKELILIDKEARK